ncbi:hypothetical protein GGR56DRAFT_348353 [Xylariaceae sp. FL0804]|nr:hypothetical protein GGR56DRAFT_348353 [Xylariaceae sp. FL0804]
MASERSNIFLFLFLFLSPLLCLAGRWLDAERKEGEKSLLILHGSVRWRALWGTGSCVSCLHGRLAIVAVRHTFFFFFFYDVFSRLTLPTYLGILPTYGYLGAGLFSDNT